LVWLFVLAFDYACISIPVTAEIPVRSYCELRRNDDAGRFGAAVSV
jgi:hypothetical protein